MHLGESYLLLAPLPIPFLMLMLLVFAVVDAVVVGVVVGVDRSVAGSVAFVYAFLTATSPIIMTISIPERTRTASTNMCQHHTVQR